MQVRDSATPPFWSTEGEGDLCTDAAAAVGRLTEIHRAGMAYLVEQCTAATEGNSGNGPVRAYYPELRFTVPVGSVVGDVDPSLSHGFVGRPGVYATTITRSVMFRTYLIEQITDLLADHGGEVEVRVSDQPIPPRVYRGFDAAAEEAAGRERASASMLAAVEKTFTPIGSACINDTIAGGEADYLGLLIKPLSLFTAQRIDLALQRLEHYTGPHAANIQCFMLFTNYQLHTDVFLEYAVTLTPGDPHGYTTLACPGGKRYDIGAIPTPGICRQHAHASQIPAYHLLCDDQCGITIIDVGVGPSNARTVTDCLAVTRPHCWMIVGHCVDLDGRIHIGDTILINSYDRADEVLDNCVPLEKPIPPIAEIQLAVTNASAHVSGLSGDELKKHLHTGTVLSTSDRNREWRSQADPYWELQKSTATGVEMESATIAANGYRFRVSYGALLSASDMPLHDKPKLPKSACEFYQSSKEEHLMAAVRACKDMAAAPDAPHSRKLRRPVGEVAFR